MRTGRTLEMTCQSEPDPACLIRVPRFDRMDAVGLLTNFIHSVADDCIFFLSGFNFLDSKGCFCNFLL